MAMPHGPCFHIRNEDDVYDNQELLVIYPTLFSINLNHRGYFSSYPGRRYVNGVLSFVDLLDTERFAISELKLVIKELGYLVEIPTYFHYREPEIVDLDNGIRPLLDDSDVAGFLELVKANNRIIDVFVEQGNTNIQLDTATQSSDVIEEKIALCWYNDKNEISEEEVENNDEDEDSDQDSDYIIDEYNDMEKSEVDMRDFRYNVDEEDDQIHNEVDLDIDVLDNENFESGSDLDENIGGIRSRNLKLLKAGADCNDSSFYLGQQFANKEDVKAFLRRHTVETRRLLKTVKDDKKRVRVMCEGDIPGKVEKPKKVNGSETVPEQETGTTSGAPRNKNKGGRGKKTNPQQYLCPWVLLVSKDDVTDTWMVKTLNAVHKCLQSRNINAMTSTFLSQQLMEQIEDNPNIPMKAVQEQFQKKYQACVSKMKAFRARSKARNQLHGDYSSQYGILRDYIEELLRTNLGTTVRVEVERVSDPSSTTKMFKRIYICLGPLKEGFKAIGRDLLGLDGAFMKGPYPGQVLSVVGVDPNNGIYPLSYAIVEAENINSWTWFLQCVGEDLGLASNSYFTFVSDRQKGILQAITNLYPFVEHRFCLRHIHENTKVSYKGKAYKDILWKLATCTTVVQFEKQMDELKKINTNAHLWLSKIDPKHWSRSHFSGRAHSDVLLNNMCEVFKSKIIDGRDKPIITELEYIREYLMRRIVNVLQVIDKSDGILTPGATKLFDIIKKDATKYVVSWNGGEDFEVSGPGGDQCVMNMQQLSYTCRKWEVTGMPCKHAVATNWNMTANGQQVGIPETWVHQVHKLETWKNVYNFKIFPINGKSLWTKSQVPTTLTPPIHHKQVGRPKKKRNRSVVELEDVKRGGKLSKRNVTVTCAKCKQMGHNSRTCTGQRHELQKKSTTGASTSGKKTNENGKKTNEKGKKGKSNKK